MRGGETEFIPNISPEEDNAVRQQEGASELTYPARLKIRGTIPAESREFGHRTDREIRNIFRGEREKTSEDLESIDYCNQLGRWLGEKYGFEWAPVLPNYVHIFPDDKFDKFHKFYHDSSRLYGSAEMWPHIDIRDVSSGYAQAYAMFHEMCHGESLQRLQFLPKENRKLFLGAKWERKIRRQGLSIRV